MATLYFEVEADYQKVVDMQREIKNLEKTMSTLDMGSKQWQAANERCQSLREEFSAMTESAARAGAEIEHKLRSSISHLKGDMDSFDKQISVATAESKRLNEQIKELTKTQNKKAKLGEDIKGISRQINDLNGKLMASEKRIASLRGQKVEVSVKYKAENERLNKILGKSSDLDEEIFGVANDFTEASKKLGSYLSDVQGDANKLLYIFKDIASTAAGVSVGNLMSGGIVAGYNQLENLAHHALNVRKEMQDIESNMGVFLKSKEKASSFTRALEAEAYFNMNEFSQLVAASKEMIAYGNQVNEIIPRIHQLSEISTGTGQNFNMLVAMYNRAKSVGYVDSRTQQTWASNGIVLQDQLRAMGENVGSKVTFEQLNKVIDRMTSEGGMFHGVMSEMMTNISSEEGQLADNLHTMYNEIGEMMQDKYISVLKFQEKMVNNWRTIGEWIASAVAAVGAYRTALVASHVVHEMISGDAGELTKKLASWAETLEKMNKEAAAKGLWEGGNLWDAFKEKKEETQEVVDTIGEVKETAAKVMETAAEEANTVATAVNTKEKGKNTASELTNAGASQTDTAAKTANTVANAANAKSQNNLRTALRRVTVAFLKNAATMLLNPYTLIATGVATLTFFIVKNALALSEEEQVAKDTNESLKEHAANVKENIEHEQALGEAITNGNLSLRERITKLKELQNAIDKGGLDIPEELIPTEDWLGLSKEEITKKIAALNQALEQARDKQDEEYAKYSRNTAAKYQGYESEWGANAIRQNVDGTYSSFSREDIQKDFDNMVRIYTPEWLDEEDEEAHKKYEKYIGDARLMLEYIQQMGEQGRQDIIDLEEKTRIEEKMLMMRKDWYELEKQRLEVAQKTQKLAQDEVENYLRINRDEMPTLGKDGEIEINKADAEKQAKQLFSDAEKLKEELGALYEQTLSATGEQKDKAEKVYKEKLQEYLSKMKEAGIMQRVTEYLASTESPFVQTVSIDTLMDFKAEKQKDGTFLEWLMDAINDKSAATLQARMSVVTSMEETDENGNIKYKAQLNVKGYQDEAQKEYKQYKEAIKKIQTNSIQEIDQAFVDGLQGAAKTSGKTYHDIIAELKKNNEVAKNDLDELLQYLNQEMGQAKTNYSSYGGTDLEGDKALNKRKAKIQAKESDAKEELSLDRSIEDAREKQRKIELDNLMTSAEKTRALEKQEHEKRIRQAERQYADEQKKAEEALKKRWETEQRNNSSDGKVGVFEDVKADVIAKALADSNSLYNKALQVAEMNRDNALAEENQRYFNINAIVEKYNKDDYRKQEAELSSTLEKLYEKRDALVKQLNQNPLDGSLKNQLQTIADTIDIITTKQRNLLTEEQKGMEAYLKTYGTLADKMKVIDAEYERRISEAKSEGDKALLRRKQQAEGSKAISEYLKDDTVSYDERRAEGISFYGKAVKDLEDEITQYHAQALDMRLSAEERANAQSLAQSAENEKRKLENSRDQQMLQLSLDQMKADPTYFMAFRDMSQVSSASLERLNAQLMQSADQLKNLPPDQLKTITDLMEKIDKTVSERDPFTAMRKHAEEAERAEYELVQAKNALYEATIKQAEAEAIYNNVLAEVQDAENMGNAEYLAAMQEYLLEVKAKLKTAQQEVTDATNRTNNAMIKVATKTSQVDKDANAIRDKIKDWGDLLKEVGNSVGGIFGEALGACGEIVNKLMDASKQMQELERQQALSNAKDSKSRKGSGIDALVDNAMGLDGKDNSKLGKKMSGIANKASMIMAGYQAGMAVGSALTTLMQKAGVGGDAKYEKYARKVAEVNKLTDSVRRYQRAALAAELAESSWFGNSSLRDLQNQWEVAQKAKDDYFAKLNQQQAAYRDQQRMDGDWLGAVTVGSLAGAAIGSSAGPWGALIGGVIGGVAGAAGSTAMQLGANNDYDKQIKRAQDNLRIETQSKHRSFMGIGGRNQKTADLREWAKEQYGEDLFDPETSMINIELAHEILDSYGDKLQGESQKTIEEMIELAEQYEEYQQSLKDYVNSLYSPLVDNMTDAIWSWFDEGRDALSAFRESASDTFRNIINDLMKQMILKNVVGKFQDDIAGLYDSFNAGDIDYATLMKQVAQKTRDMTDSYEKTIPMLEDAVTVMADTIESATGIDISATTSRSGGTSNAFSGMSQDTGNEMNGRLTAIQLQGETSIGILTTMSAQQLQLLTTNYEQTNILSGIHQQMATSYLELQGIHEDTMVMAKGMKAWGEKMNDWDSHIKKL